MTRENGVTRVTRVTRGDGTEGGSTRGPQGSKKIYNYEL